MTFNTELLALCRGISQNYQARLNVIAKAHGLSALEGEILSFLHCNPEVDTPSVMIGLLGLSKGDTSMAVDHLVRLGYLSKSRDEKDRRKNHLHLLASSEIISQEIDRMRAEFLKEILRDFSPEDKKKLKDYLQKVFSNVTAQ
ncbi:MAG: MarR family transcriptional regulator [Bacilli bacterium]|jgi:DNA-binding MarR family transcriptional regulator|nr:MarR family transcriptional regulator [Bacilli bacterium]